jgi:glycosyltransferase involved in cell wall biosynthesis
MLSGAPDVAFLANHGSVGGGEVMLLEMAAAASSVGTVAVVGPEKPDDLWRLSGERELPYYAVPGTSRSSYMTSLRRYVQRVRPGLSWCNGGTPALATIGLRLPRVIHLHQVPPRSQRLAIALARVRVAATVVPSSVVANKVGGSRILSNWSAPIERVTTPRLHAEVLRVGFLGRLSTDKGLDVLATAVVQLNSGGAPCRLVVAGDDRFVPPKQARIVEEKLSDLGSQVECLGWTEPSALFARCDVLVVPSTWPEPFGLVAAEAMSAGMALVVSTAGALPEIVGPGYPWIFKAGDADELVSVLRQLHGQPDEVSRWRRAGFERWSTLYSPATGRGHFLELLNQVQGSVR